VYVVPANPRVIRAGGDGPYSLDHNGGSGAGGAACTFYIPYSSGVGVGNSADRREHRLRRPPAAAPDTGLVRESAGVVRVSNASSDLGGLPAAAIVAKGDLSANFTLPDGDAEMGGAVPSRRATAARPRYPPESSLTYLERLVRHFWN
jgi:hypothetical protein